MGYTGYMWSGMRLRAVSTECIVLKPKDDGLYGYMQWAVRLRSVSTEGIVLKVTDGVP